LPRRGEASGCHSRLDLESRVKNIVNLLKLDPRVKPEDNTSKVDSFIDWILNQVQDDGSIKQWHLVAARDNVQIKSDTGPRMITA
jgi:hypothetical protein